MLKKNKKIISSTGASKIKVSKKPITILFTDIEGSTKHWDEYGDINGRLMVDRHNRLIFPVIKKFRGKLVKTIGDGVMGSFKKPGNALKAAVAIQQVLENERQRDSDFKIKVRIGIHTGTAIIESKDIYGDAVNMAARVESHCKAGEILASYSTAAKLNKKDFKLIKRDSFIPKGKKKAIVIYNCDWEAFPSLIQDIRFHAYVPVVPRQKMLIGSYAIVNVFTLYFLYLKYFRYIIADSEYLALLILNPQDFFYKHPAISGVVVSSFLILAVIILAKETIPHIILRFTNGGFNFCLVFFTIYLSFIYIPTDVIPKSEEIIFQSKHLFVEVLEDNTNIHQDRSFESPVVMTANSGTLILLSDIKSKNKIQWNKVLIGKKKFGWIPRVIPAKIGEPEKRLTLSNKFYFKYRDLYALIIAMIGFLWGFFNFRIQPA